jgi:hypothetical protein
MWLFPNQLFRGGARERSYSAPNADNKMRTMILRTNTLSSQL